MHPASFLPIMLSVVARAGSEASDSVSELLVSQNRMLSEQMRLLNLQIEVLTKIENHVNNKKGEKNIIIKKYHNKPYRNYEQERAL